MSVGIGESLASLFLFALPMDGGSQRQKGRRRQHHRHHLDRRSAASALYIEETDVRRRWGIRRRWLGCRYLSALYCEPCTPLVRIVVLGWSFQIGRIPMYDDFHRRMT